jgi:hypothetical protein
MTDFKHAALDQIETVLGRGGHLENSDRIALAQVYATLAQTQQIESISNLIEGVMGDCTIRVERVS